MKISRVDSWAERMRLREPYAIAQRRYEQAVNVFLRIETDRGPVGYGCAAPEADVTGERVEDTQRLLDDVAAGLLRGEDPLRWMRLAEAARVALLPDAPAALAAVDMALRDLLGKVAGLPLHLMLGAYRECIATSVTIGILDRVETVARAEGWVAQGFRCLKLKGGDDVEGDIERVIAVRAAVGPEIELRFDANQGYRLADAQRFVAEVACADLAVLEQPTVATEPDLLGRLRHTTDAAVMADESLLGLRDAFRLAGNQRVDMVNVKLMKVGGFVVARDVAAVARAGNLSLMVGCMDESALGIAAALHFALSHPSVEMADLDGHLPLEDDPFAGAVTLRDGVLYPALRPGLGALRKR